MAGYAGMILGFAGAYEPLNWLFCDGRELNIAEYTALFEVIGNTYGGDGITKFNLPDLTLRIPVGAGRGTDLPTERVLGEMGGVREAAMTADMLPAHTHPLNVSTSAGTYYEPLPDYTLAAISNTGYAFYDSATDTTNPAVLKALNAVSVLNTGDGAPHPNVMPYQTINYIICYKGSFF